MSKREGEGGEKKRDKERVRGVEREEKRQGGEERGRETKCARERERELERATDILNTTQSVLCMSHKLKVVSPSIRTDWYLSNNT